MFEQPKTEPPRPTVRMLTYRAAHALAGKVTEDPVGAYRVYLDLAMNARAESHRTMHLAIAAAAGLLLLVLGALTGGTAPRSAQAQPLIWWGLGALALSASFSFLARFVDVLRLNGVVSNIGTAVGQVEKDRVATAIYFLMRVTAQRRLFAAETLFYEGLAFLVAGFATIVLGLYLSAGAT